MTESMVTNAQVVSYLIRKAKVNIEKSRPEVRGHLNIYFGVIIVAIRDAFTYSTKTLTKKARTDSQYRAERNFHVRRTSKTREQAQDWLQSDDFIGLVRLMLPRKEAFLLQESATRVVDGFESAHKLYPNTSPAKLMSMQNEAANEIKNSIKKIWSS